MLSPLDHIVVRNCLFPETPDVRDPRPMEEQEKNLGTDLKMKKEFYFAFLLFSAAAGAAELYVSPAGNDRNPGSAKAPFATIGRAAQAAKPGDTVKIGPGLYREQISFRKSGKPTSRSRRIRP